MYRRRFLDYQSLYFQGLASYCKAETTFTFHFSILTLWNAFLSIDNREKKVNVVLALQWLASLFDIFPGAQCWSWKGSFITLLFINLFAFMLSHLLERMVLWCVQSNCYWRYARRTLVFMLWDPFAVRADNLSTICGPSCAANESQSILKYFLHSWGQIANQTIKQRKYFDSTQLGFT